VFDVGGVFGGASNVFPQAPVGQPVGMNLGMANGVVPQAMPTMPAMGAMPTAPVGISIYRISRKRKPDSKR